MSELKSLFIEFCYPGVFTHLHSGNVVFSIDERDEIILADNIKAMIEERCGLDIPILVILQEALKDLLNKTSDWWKAIMTI